MILPVAHEQIRFQIHIKALHSLHHENATALDCSCSAVNIIERSITEMRLWTDEHDYGKWMTY